MNKLLLALVMTAACGLAAGQGRTGGKTSGNEPPPIPKTGVRFVVLPGPGKVLPSPVYVKQGKNFYRSVRLGSRTPSVRVTPTAGVVDFLESDPTANAVGDDKSKKELPEVKTVMSVKLQQSFDKTLCILSPSENGNPTVRLVNEADFPQKGVHIINLSTKPLLMETSLKGDFSDKKANLIKAGSKITKENTWSFNDGADGQAVSFRLTTYAKEVKDRKTLRSSRFAVSAKQSQINVVVDNPRTGGVQFLSIQLTDH